MVEFLTFKSFISIEALIILYYIGALVLPILLWMMLLWFTNKYKLFNTLYETTKEALWQVLNLKQRIQLSLFFFISFIFMQLFWRIFFEFLIAYMQIRDSLLLI